MFGHQPFDDSIALPGSPPVLQRTLGGIRNSVEESHPILSFTDDDGVRTSIRAAAPVSEVKSVVPVPFSSGLHLFPKSSPKAPLTPPSSESLPSVVPRSGSKS